MALFVCRELLMSNGCSFFRWCFRILRLVRSGRLYFALQLSCFRVCVPMNYSNSKFFLDVVKVVKSSKMSLYSVYLHVMISKGILKHKNCYYMKLIRSKCFNSKGFKRNKTKHKLCLKDVLFNNVDIILLWLCLLIQSA